MGDGALLGKMSFPKLLVLKEVFWWKEKKKLRDGTCMKQVKNVPFDC